MKKQSIFKKLMLANIAYAVPLAIVCYFLVSANEDTIQFAEAERKGVELVLPANELMVELSLHRFETQRVLNGLKQRESNRSSHEEAISRLVSKLTQVGKNHEEALRLDAKNLGDRDSSHLAVSQISKRWTDLKDKWKFMSVSEANEAHASIVNDVKALIAYVGDSSNLILDPDLDSYYLMDIVILAVPDAVSRMNNLIANLEPGIRTSEIATEDRASFIHQILTVEEIMLPRIEASAQVALNEDEGAYGSYDRLQNELGEELGDLAKSKKELLELLSPVLRSRGLSISVDDYLAKTDSSLNSIRKFASVSGEILDDLLEIRQEHYQQQKILAIIGAALTVLFCSIFMFFISKTFSSSMNRIVQRLNLSSDTTKEASQELVAMSQELSSASTQQASAIQESVATVNEINAMVTKTLENARLTAEMSQNSNVRAEQGQVAVGQMISSINEISDSNTNILNQVESSNRQIAEIVNVINEIGAKTKVINDIVFQTKLLSFNASVEAARAGEHGKGFAVVAEEVGNLAQMSGNAAKEISDMLGASVEKVNGIVQETQSKIEGLISVGKSKVEGGKAVAQQCGESLKSIVSAVKDMNSKIIEITKAAEEQARGVNEITKAMNQLEEATNQNSSMAAETANQSRQLSEQATELSLITSDVTVEVFGDQSEAKNSSERPALSLSKSDRVSINRMAPAREESPKVSLKRFGRDDKPLSTEAYVSESKRNSAVAVNGLPSESDPRFEDL